MRRAARSLIGGLRNAARAVFGIARRMPVSSLADAAKQAARERPALQGLMQLIPDRAADAIFLTGPNGRIAFANPEAERTFGFRLDEMLGQDLHNLLHRDHADAAASAHDDCPLSKIQKAGATLHNHEDVFYRKDASAVSVSCSYAPFEEKAAAGGGIFVVRDTGPRKAMLTALKESEERLRLATEAAGIGTFTFDVEAGRASYSPELLAMLGLPAICSARIEDAFARVHRDDTARFLAKYHAGLQGADGGLLKMDFRFVIPGGDTRWMTWTGRVDFRDGPSGREAFRVAGACVDITERKRAEEALRESEERFRGIFDHAAIGIAITDLEGRFQSCNPAYSEMLGYTQEELRALNFSCLVYPDDREADLVNRSRLIHRWTSSSEALTRYTGKDGRLIWAHKHVSLLTNAAGKPGRMLALVTDVTERRRQEEKIRLLAREVNHRSKNLLTLVLAVARQTFAAKPGDFMGRFEERIEALAASHGLAFKNRWKGAYLDELVRSQIACFKDLIGSRIELKGPPLPIVASAAQTIGMALHELATNAGKHGALSSAAGGIRIEWRAGGEAASDARFELIWAEHGGPPVAPPARTGFGTVLIEDIPRAELNAEVTLTYAPEGFHWRLSCPAASILEPLG